MNSSLPGAAALMATEFTHAVRQVELELALPLLPRGAKVLELGAGDGWQARQLQGRGFDVSAIDIKTPFRHAAQYFPVTLYDGTNLPFTDKSFDAIYSSNVLEHVSEFEKVQQDLARILRPGGIAVHCVPSAVWRFWTTFGHPLYVMQKTWQILASYGKAKSSSPLLNHQRAALNQLNLSALLRAALISPRHGEHGSLLSEHWHFSSRSWEKRFKASGWHIASIVPCEIFYTGNELLGLWLTTAIRQRLAPIFGSSSVIFVLKPPHSEGSEP